MDRFVKEWPAAELAMRSYLTHVQGTGRWTTIKKVIDKVKKTKGKSLSLDDTADYPEFRSTAATFSFAINGPLQKRDDLSLENFRRDEGESTKAANEDHTFAKYTICRNASNSFTLGWKTPDSTPTVRQFGKPSEVDRQLGQGLLPYITAPFTIGGHPLSELMADPDFSIKHAFMVDIYGIKCVKIEFTCDSKVNRLKSGWFIFSPSESWSIQSYETSNHMASPFSRQVVEYERPIRGIPVPKRVTSAIFRSRHIFEFDHIEPCSLPDSQFTLSAYGLPDLQNPGLAKRTNTTVYWLLGGAIVSAILSIILRKASMRSVARQNTD